MTGLAVVMGLGLASCGASDKTPADTPDAGLVGGGHGSFKDVFTVTGYGFKGLIKNGGVMVFALEADPRDPQNEATVLKRLHPLQQRSGEDGLFSITTTEGSPTGCAYIEVQGETGTIHRDEFLETDVEYPHGTLSAATCDLAANLGPIAVTPLTTLAAWQARYMIDRGAPMKAAVDLANAEIARRFGASC